MKDLEIEMSCFLLRQIGDQFCALLQQECEAKNHNLNEGMFYLYHAFNQSNATELNLYDYNTSLHVN